MTIQMAKEAHDLALSEAKAIKFNRHDGWDMVAVPLYATMIEKAGSILMLFRQDVDAGAETIFRSFLEAYVDLKNLLADADYIKVCRLAYHEEWLKVLTESTKGNPFLAGISSHEQFNEVLDDHKARIEELRTQGVKAERIFDRFRMAGMEEVYRSAYHFAAAESHNNIRSLLNRHINVADNGEAEVVMYRGFDEGKYEALLDSLCGPLADVSVGLHEHFNSGRAPVFAEFMDRLQQHRTSK